MPASDESLSEMTREQLSGVRPSIAGAPQIAEANQFVDGPSDCREAVCPLYGINENINQSINDRAYGMERTSESEDRAETECDGNERLLSR